MREFKIIAAGACALMAVGSLFSLLGGLQSAGGSGNMSYMLGRIAGMVLLAALAVALWRDANKRNPPL